MRNTTLLWHLVILIGCGSPVSSLANEAILSTLPTIAIPQNLSSEEDSASVLESPSLVIATPRGKEVGEVKDLILDLTAGRIAYIVGAFNRLPQLSEKLFFIPWEKVSITPEMENFALVGDELVLEKSPYVSSITWRTQSLSSGTSRADRYWKKYSVDPGQENDSSPTYARASDLVGMPVQGAAQKPLGTVEELLLNPDTGQISYVILSVKTEPTSGSKTFFSLPWSVIRAREHQRPPSTVMTRNQVAQNQNALGNTVLETDSSLGISKERNLRFLPNDKERVEKESRVLPSGSSFGTERKS